MRFRSILADTSNAAKRRYCRAWDFSQANDRAVLDRDPDKERALDAGKLLKTDPERAFPILLVLAESGSVWSMLNVGYCFYRGVGVAANASAAEDWYRRAYEAGSQRGLLDYGEILVLRRKLDLYESLYAAAATEGWSPALYRLAMARLRGSRKREALLAVLPLMERAAELGNPSAQWWLGRKMAWGKYGLGNVVRGLRLIWTVVGEHFADMELAPSNVPVRA